MNPEPLIPQASIPPKPSERRVFWLSLLGGSASGVLFVWVALWSALSGQPRDMGARAIDQVLGDLFGLLVIPIAVTLLAPRRTFLWASFALLVHLFWSVTDRLVLGNWTGLVADLKGNGLYHLIAALLFCGPVAIIRFLARRRAERAAAAIHAQEQAWREASEGVWPPPPRRQ